MTDTISLVIETDESDVARSTLNLVAQQLIGHQSDTLQVEMSITADSIKQGLPATNPTCVGQVAV